MKILVTPTSFKPDNDSPAMNKLKAFADELVFNPYGRPMTEDELVRLLPGCSGMVAGLDFLTAKAIGSADSLKVISRYGAGCRPLWTSRRPAPAASPSQTHRVPTPKPWPNSPLA